MLVPMVDLVNHYAHEQCTTEILHIGLEKEQSKEKRESVDYRKLRGNFDISLLLPKSDFDPGNRKTNAVHFIETFSRKIYDYQRVTEEEEQKEAMEVASMLINKYEFIELWSLPNWTSSCKEDNDSSEEVEDDSEEEFFAQLTKLKSLVEPNTLDSSKSKLPTSPLQDEIAKNNKENAERRKDVMDFDVGPTQKASTYDRLTKEAHSDSNILDKSQSYSEYQEEFPWYNSMDKDVSFMDNLGLLCDGKQP